MIQKSGSWLLYGGEKVGQGRDAARMYLKENPRLLEEIENKVRDKIQNPDAVLTAAGPAPAETE